MVSDIISATIFILIALHYFFHLWYKDRNEDARMDMCVVGRHFMLQAMMFIAWIAISALTFSTLVSLKPPQSTYLAVSLD